MFDLEFYELSMIADDPKKLEQLKNHFYDPDFDDWLEDFEEEQEKKSLQANESTTTGVFGGETVTRSQESRNMDFPTEEYDISEPTGLSDWEEVN